LLDVSQVFKLLSNNVVLWQLSWTSSRIVQPSKHTDEIHILGA